MTDRRRASKTSAFSSASRRGARSIWSKINVDKVAALIEAGRMQASGYAQIEPVNTHARWARACGAARTSELPADLLAALEAEPRAKAFFAIINAANRYAVLWRIQATVKPEPPARRVARLVEIGDAGARRDHSQLRAQ